VAPARVTVEGPRDNAPFPQMQAPVPALGADRLPADSGPRARL